MNTTQELDEPKINYDVTDPGRRYFLPVTVTAAVFVISLFAWIAAGAGDPAAPVNQWINKYGPTVIFIETGVVAVACVLAMYLDRQATLRVQAKKRGHGANHSVESDTP